MKTGDVIMLGCLAAPFAIIGSGFAWIYLCAWMKHRAEDRAAREAAQDELRAVLAHDEFPNLAAAQISPTPGVPPALAVPPTGKHHAGQVQTVDSGYWPLIGTRRLAAEAPTERMELPR